MSKLTDYQQAKFDEVMGLHRKYAGEFRAAHGDANLISVYEQTDKEFTFSLTQLCAQIGDSGQTPVYQYLSKNCGWYYTNENEIDSLVHQGYEVQKLYEMPINIAALQSERDQLKEENERLKLLLQDGSVQDEIRIQANKG